MNHFVIYFQFALLFKTKGYVMSKINKRIMVIGCPGSGKSTFSKRLSQLTGIDLTHLDKLGWKTGWVKESRENFDKKLCDVIVKDSWIIDGNYSRTMEMRLQRADIVFQFKLSTFDCLYGHIKRVIKGKLGEKRSDITAGCDECFDIEFVKYIIGFKNENEKNNQILLSKYPNVKVISFYSRAQADKYLKGLEKYYSVKR